MNNTKVAGEGTPQLAPLNAGVMCKFYNGVEAEVWVRVVAEAERASANSHHHN